MSSLQPSIRTLFAPPYTISIPSEGRRRVRRPKSSPTKKGASGVNTGICLSGARLILLQDTQSRRWTRFRGAGMMSGDELSVG
ncbi:hypothetical protein MKEN_00285200 [Mycena kentingensis (nom. inval.)]|nr:hypothetical protein MKEN_00285200 [Mycena kentingensis (nom. inval.)]